MKKRTNDAFDALHTTMKEIARRAEYDPMHVAVYGLNEHDEFMMDKAGITFPSNAVVQGKASRKEWTADLALYNAMAINGLLNFVNGNPPSVTFEYPGMKEVEDESEWGTDDGSVAWAKQMVAEVESRLVAQLPKAVRAA